MEVISININERTGAGKKNARKVRREGRIPCVLYGIDQNIHFSVRHKDIKPLVFTPNFKLAEINADGVSHKCFVKDVQLHPVTDEVMHMDFLKLEKGRRVNVEIPVRFHGVSPGVKDGGTLTQKLRKLKVKVLPENIISEVSVDISELALGDTVRVRDIPEMEGVEIVNATSIPLASVQVPRALKSAEMEAAEEEAAAGEAEGGEEGDSEGGDS